MRIVKPTVFDRSLLLSTNAVESNPVWAPGTYNLGDVVIHPGLDLSGVEMDRLWTSLIENNTSEPSESNQNWFNFAPSNRFAAFDNQISTQTSAMNTLTFVVSIGSVTSLGLLNVVAADVRVVIRGGQGGEVLFDQTRSLSGDNPINWFEYFYYEDEARLTSALFEYPVLPFNAVAEITLNSQGMTSIGSVVFGRSSEIGTTQYGMTGGVIDFSRKETDEFGNTTFVRRAFSKRVSANVMINTAQIGRASRVLYGIRSTPTLFILTDDTAYEELAVVFGYYRDFNVEVSYPTFALCSIEIEGLI